jgi:hypothetical protein
LQHLAFGRLPLPASAPSRGLGRGGFRHVGRSINPTQGFVFLLADPRAE